MLASEQWPRKWQEPNTTPFVPWDCRALAAKLPTTKRGPRGGSARPIAAKTGFAKLYRESSLHRLGWKQLFGGSKSLIRGPGKRRSHRFGRGKDCICNSQDLGALRRAA